MSRIPVSAKIESAISVSLHDKDGALIGRIQPGAPANPIVSAEIEGETLKVRLNSGTMKSYDVYDLAN
jgi:hypothetical protein